MKRINKKYAQINELKAMLAKTDYHVIKEAEGGCVVPQEIVDDRVDARNQINILEAEIAELKVQQEEFINEIE